MNTPNNNYDTAFFGHPRGLSTLFFTEMWERFSYYGMRALLILFMTAQVSTGGLGFDRTKAGAIYGMYVALAYMLAVPGGWLADRFIGQRKAVLYGGICIMLGNFMMAVPGLTTFYLGLAFSAVGTGLLKPNVSTLVGGLYTPEDKRRDAGFSIYYMGINLGATIAPLVSGYLGQEVSWHWGFLSAGIGMTLGLLQYLWGSKFLGTTGLAPTGQSDEKQQASDRQTLRLGAVALFGIPALLAVGQALGWWALDATRVSDGFGVLLLLIVVAVFASLFFGDWTSAERKRIAVIFVLFLAASLFWSLFEQAGSTLNLFAEEKTKNEIFGIGFPSSWFQFVNPGWLILLSPVFGWLWLKLGDKEPSIPGKFVLGLVLVGAGFLVLVGGAKAAANGEKASPWWLTITYLLHTAGELCLSPVGLSAMTKLAPARVVGLMMGVWFLATSVGNYIAGRLAGVYENMPLPDTFLTVGLVGITFGIALALFLKPLQRMINSSPSAK